jgi:hypothetical protein
MRKAFITDVMFISRSHSNLEEKDIASLSAWVKDAKMMDEMGFETGSAIT